MFKYTLNYETGEYEFVDENGFRLEEGDFTFNFDRTPFEQDDMNNPFKWQNDPFNNDWMK